MALDGCIGVDCTFIFLPRDERKNCPFCGQARYSASGQPNERVWYFPILPRLSALMRLASFRKNINYEKTRAVFANSEYMADVYDTPAWRQNTGEPARDQTGSGDEDSDDDDLDNSIYYDEATLSSRGKNKGYA